MARGRAALTKQAVGPYGAEVSRALDLIRQGLNDGAIAAAISVARSHGEYRCDPSHIADLRKDA